MNHDELLWKYIDGDCSPEEAAQVERRLAAALGLPEGAALPVVPYWNADVPTDGKLTDAERDSVKLVKATLRDVLAEAGGVPMDPFGANKE